MAGLEGCPISAKGIGIKGCLSGNPLMMPYKVVLGVPGFSFDSYDDFKDETVINTAIAAQNLFPLEKFIDIDDNTKEKAVYESGSGDEFTTRQSRRGFTGWMDMTLKQNQYLQAYGNTGWTIFLIDEAGNWEGHTPDGTTVTGYTAASVEPEPMMRTFGTDGVSKSGIKIMLEYNEEMDEQIVLAEADDLDFNIKELQPLTLVTITNATFDTDEVIASFNIVNDRSANNTSTPTRSIETTEASIIDQAGATIVPTVATETATEGTWNFTATTNLITAGTIELLPTATSLFYSEITTMTAA